jgi:methionyl-tRNA formyltransferase
VIRAGHDVRCLVTLTPEAMGRRSDGCDLGPLAVEAGIPVHYTANVNSEDCIEFLERQDLDVLVVLGWSQILGKAVLRTAGIGAIGAHASYLPHNRGSAPVNWALIKGEREGGNTLMWLSAEVDAGDIIDQAHFPISSYDTCKTVYDKVARTNRQMILRALAQLEMGELQSYAQPPTDEEILPRRRPKDGLIDWRADARSVYNFIRALTKPYPGAFSSLSGMEVTIWQASLPEFVDSPVDDPGRILGRVVSPTDGACGVAVACGSGYVIVHELETTEHGRVAGRALAEAEWMSGCFENENRPNQ